MGIAILVLSLLLRAYILVLWARLIMDWVLVLRPGFRPKGFVAVLFEAVFWLTDPPLKLIRKFLPPIRLGAVSIDVGWLILMVLCNILLMVLAVVASA